MSFGKMSERIQIVQTVTKTDREGFAYSEEEVTAEVKAYREGRHGSEKWANTATFSTATDLFRFRRIPYVEVSTDMLIICRGQRFEITSVEDVRGKGMYIEVLAKAVTPSG